MEKNRVELPSDLAAYTWGSGMQYHGATLFLLQSSQATGCLCAREAAIDFFIYILAGGTLCDPFCTPVTTCTQIVVTDTGSQGRLSITA